MNRVLTIYQDVAEIISGKLFQLQKGSPTTPESSVASPTGSSIATPLVTPVVSTESLTGSSLTAPPATLLGIGDQCENDTECATL